MKKAFKLVVLALLVSVIAVPALSAQNVKIDYRVNAAAEDSANFLNWSLGNTQTKDKFDAATGASLAKSTAGLDAVRYDAADTKKMTMPVALRGFLLYPVSDYKTLTDDAFTVTADGKMITVRFVHRGVAYELVTDKNGKLDVLTGAKIARGLADNVGGKFVLKPEFVKAGGDANKMTDLDWSKITLVADTKDPVAKRWYTGTLDFAFSKNILTVKGTLTEKK